MREGMGATEGEDVVVRRSHDEEFGFYSKCSRESERGLNQGSAVT